VAGAMTRHYPTRPIIGVLGVVRRAGRVLLVQRARAPSVGKWGFPGGVQELGETIFAAVARELREEAGIAITGVRYFGSQPWPFTGSLMIGFTARWAAGEIVADASEIADADWFSPEALPRVPPKLSIARELIDDFVRRHGGAPLD